MTIKLKTILMPRHNNFMIVLQIVNDCEVIADMECGSFATAAEAMEFAGDISDAGKQGVGIEIRSIDHDAPFDPVKAFIIKPKKEPRK